MRRVTVADLEEWLSRCLRLVKQGETPTPRGGEAHLRELRRDGVVSPPAAKVGLELVRRPPVPCRGDVVASLVEERRRR